MSSADERLSAVPARPGTAQTMTTAHDTIASAYDDWSAVYDADNNATRDLNAEVLRGELEAFTGKDVLEIGCGTGLNTVWIAESARSVVAVDFSSGMLAKARERVRSDCVRFVQHDIRNAWPVTAASFDVVITTLVLEHIEHLDPIFVELKRVLRPGGMAYLAELHPERQRRGSQGRFATQDGSLILVSSTIHHEADYELAGMNAGLQLVCRKDRSNAADIAKQSPPRLITFFWRNESTK